MGFFLLQNKAKASLISEPTRSRKRPGLGYVYFEVQFRKMQEMSSKPTKIL